MFARVTVHILSHPTLDIQIRLYIYIYRKQKSFIVIAVGPTISSYCFTPENAHEAFVLEPRKWRIKRLDSLGQVMIWNLQVT